MGILGEIILLFISGVWAQTSVCGSYDVENIHPQNLKSNLVINCMHQGEDFYLDGVIEENLIFEISMFNEKPIKRIFLNSSGGRVENAYEVAEFIREQKIETIVRPEAECMSACTLLFQAGTNRLAHESSIFMYHGVRFSQETKATKIRNYDCLNVLTTDVCLEEIKFKEELLWKQTKDFFNQYVLYGASEDLYKDYISLDEDAEWIKNGNYLRIKDWYISHESLMKYNVVLENESLLWDKFTY